MKKYHNILQSLVYKLHKIMLQVKKNAKWDACSQAIMNSVLLIRTRIKHFAVSQKLKTVKNFECAEILKDNFSMF
jgi:hypothetical protein